jgi:hypothetical protein
VHIRVNTPPIADPDYATTDEDVPVVIDVLANDEDPDGRQVRLDTFDAVGYGVDGVAVADISRDGNALRVVPRSRYFGQFSFNYQILDSDDAQAEQPGLVAVSVIHVNHPPKAKDDKAVTDEDVPITIDVLANDSDRDEGDELYVDRVTRAEHGQVINQGGNVRYEPEANWYGDDSFSYVVRDQDGAEAGADVKITVKSVNDPPVIQDQAYFLWCCNLAELNVLKDATDSDSKIDYKSLTIFKAPHKGKAKVRLEPADIGYRPNIAYRGKTELEVTVADQQGAVSKPARITLTIGAIAGMINEIVPSEGKIELYNPDSTKDITGWTIAGYTIGSNPGRESYSQPPFDANLAPSRQFATKSHLVLTLPGVDLRFGRIELRDAGGRLREAIEPDRSCYQREHSGSRSLARRWDGFAAFNNCLEYHWVGDPTLGVAN